MTKLPIVMALAQDQQTQVGDRQNGHQTELERLKKLILETEILPNWPEDPLLNELKQIIYETIGKFSLEKDGAWHNNRLNLRGESEEVAVKMEDDSGVIFIPAEVKIKTEINKPINRGRLFERSYIKINVLIKRPPVKAGKKFFQPISHRVILYDLQKGGAKIISAIDR